MANDHDGPRDDVIVAGLRQMAESNASVVEMVWHLIRVLRLSPDERGRYRPFQIQRFFVDAFGMSVGRTCNLALWRCFVGGSYSDDDIAEMYGGLVKSRG